MPEIKTLAEFRVELNKVLKDLVMVVVPVNALGESDYMLLELAISSLALDYADGFCRKVRGDVDGT